MKHVSFFFNLGFLEVKKYFSGSWGFWKRLCYILVNIFAGLRNVSLFLQPEIFGVKVMFSQIVDKSEKTVLYFRKSPCEINKHTLFLQLKK